MSNNSNHLNNCHQLDQSNSIYNLLIRPTGLESDNLNAHDTIGVHYFTSKVIQLKSLISNNWDGKPRLEGIRLIARGRILNDDKLIGPALSKQTLLLL
ncbi:hypothetical protein BY996DRAFT_6657972 [Phakopsora pachyrhizi]|nr:hypothetical protein BY996DRAFT_6657972 [Phakopsora pachyrhizi]